VQAKNHALLPSSPQNGNKVGYLFFFNTKLHL